MAIMRQRTAPQWQLDEDKWTGMRRSIDSNQPQLALMYTESVVTTQQEEIEALRNELAQLRLAIADLSRLATSDKPAARRTEKPAEPSE